KYNGTTLATAALSGGQASWAGVLPGGTHTVTAIYLGDANYLASTTAPFSQTVLNAAPVILSQPTATPTAATVNETVRFSVVASDPDGQTIRYLWDYGDGANDSTGAHAYAAPGVYSVTLLVSDGTASLAGNTLTVVVTAPAAGSEPAISAGEISFVSLKATVRASGGRDSLLLTGTLDAATEPQGKAVSINIGGIEHSFILDKRGRGKTKFANIALKRIREEGSTTHHFRLACKGLSLKQSWNVEQRSGAPLRLLLTVEVDERRFGTKMELTYSGTEERGFLTILSAPE
ncbi:MAG TPA: PKD domain-containing protein, partial [Planctomycetota bacterium]|nr:PKD domain-containing protein [Planctomycetota bacterium]